MAKESSPWRSFDLNHARDPEPPDIAQPQQKHTNQSMVNPNNTYTSVNLNPFCFARNASSLFFPGFAPHGYFSATVTAQDPRRFLVFDQSGDQTNLVYSSACSPFPTRKNVSDGTNVSDGPGDEEEMHEDTEEIDALLYSDSEDQFHGEEEEGSTGHTPIETVTACACSTTKRRRGIEEEEEADTASSEWSCVGGNGDGSKRVKRERIQETVGVLRRIIPGGKGKDAAGVLDEAIKYLKAVRIKAKAMGTASFL